MVQAASDAEARAFAKVVRRLIPLMMTLFVVSYLDRVNVSFAALTMNADLGFNAQVYGWGAGILFIGYFLFEVPSNLVLAKVGARIWICRIMITWGLISASTAFVTSATSFYALRFLLGAAEAGFFPGMILYLGYWFPLAMRARYTAMFMAAVPIATALGAPFSALILQTHGLFGLSGWQWLFLIEGVPACILGIVVFLVLPDGPRDAKWLDPDEKQAIDARLAADHAGHDETSHDALWPALRDPRVLLLGVVYFGLVVGLYGIGLWLPQIIRAMGYTTGEVGLILVIPYALAAVGMLLWGRHSDHTGERVLHVVGGALLGVIGLVGSVHAGSPLLAIAAVTLAAVGIYSALGPFWSVPPLFLRGTAAAGGIALINSIGNLGGFVGPYLVGWTREATGSFTAGFEALAAIVGAAGLLALALRAMVRRSAGRTAPAE